MQLIIVMSIAPWELEFPFPCRRTSELFVVWQTIKDPKGKKPEEWDEREEIADPADIKPAGYDDIAKQVASPTLKLVHLYRVRCTVV